MPPSHCSASVRKIQHQHTALLLGVALYAFEAFQSIALIPFFRQVLGSTDAANWISLTTSAALINLAYACYYQPIIRNISSTLPAMSLIGLPDNWRQLRNRMCAIGAPSLLCAQVIFACVFFTSRPTHDATLLWTCLLFFGAQYLKMLSFNNFAILNGLRRVGQDKQALLIASGINLLLIVILTYVFKSMLAAAFSSLVAGAFALALSERFVRNAENPRDAAIALFPRRKEMTGLAMLNIGGYLNIGTDILLASAVLPPDSALQYALTSRVATILVTLTGLYTQVKFPFWAAHSNGAKNSQNLWPESLWKAFSLAIILIATIFCLSWFLHETFARALPIWLIATVFANSTVAAGTVLMGQFLTAKRFYGFVKPAILVASAAPFLAYALSAAVGTESFALGYLTANLALGAIHFLVMKKYLTEQNSNA